MISVNKYYNLAVHCLSISFALLTLCDYLVVYRFIHINPRVSRSYNGNVLFVAHLYFY